MLPRPVLDRIIALRSAPESQVGKIIVPESAQSTTDNKPQTATVLAVGPGLKTPKGGHRLMAVMPGDKIVFSRYTGGDVPGHPGCIILRESDVLGIVE